MLTKVTSSVAFLEHRMALFFWREGYMGSCTMILSPTHPSWYIRNLELYWSQQQQLWQHSTLEMIFHNRKNHDSHTDTKRTCVQHFFYSEWRNLPDVVTKAKSKKASIYRDYKNVETNVQMQAELPPGWAGGINGPPQVRSEVARL